MSNESFDTDKYIALQIEQIRNMLDRSGEKTYLEIGGKLIQDRHAARVLPGYREDARFEIVKRLSFEGDVVIVVSARDILRGRIRGDFKITYDKETVRTIRELAERGLPVKHVAISMIERNREISDEIVTFEKELAREGAVSYRFFASSNYERSAIAVEDLNLNPFIDLPARCVVVIGPGGGSGKFGICISQLYYEMKRGVSPRYFSLGAFPLYDLPYTHPLNLSYLAASADIQDKLCEDPRAANSLLTEREVENYALLRQLSRLFETEGRYLREIASATDMCISALSRGIINDEEVRREAGAEIARRYMRYKFEVARGEEKPETLERVKEILNML